MHYFLTRNGIKYEIAFEKDKVTNKIIYCLVSLEKDKAHEDKYFKHLTAIRVTNENYQGYISIRNDDHKKAIKDFLILKTGDKLEISDNLSEIDVKDDEYQIKIFNLKREECFNFFPSFSKRTQRLLKFIGLAAITLLLLTLTILTAGAALGAVLPGAIGFVGAVSTLTGAAISALVSVQACIAFVSISIGSFLLGLASLTAALHLGNSSQKEKFFQLPQYWKSKFNDLTPWQKAAIAVTCGFLAIGLITLGGWAMAVMIGTLSGTVAIVGGFLTTLGGLAALSGISIVSETLGMISLLAAVGFAEQVKNNRQLGLDWVQRPEMLPTNEASKDSGKAFLDNDGLLKSSKSLFEIWSDLGETEEEMPLPDPFKAAKDRPALDRV